MEESEEMDVENDDDDYYYRCYDDDEPDYDADGEDNGEDA